jgi:hypothetical protein
MNPERAIRARFKPGLLAACFALFLVLLAPVAGRAQAADPDFGQKLAMAEGFHDLAILYIKSFLNFRVSTSPNFCSTKH